MKKSIDYILGIITGLAIAFAISSSRVEAHSSSSKGDSVWNPIYVKIVE